MLVNSENGNPSFLVIPDKELNGGNDVTIPIRKYSGIVPDMEIFRKINFPDRKVFEKVK